MANKINSSSFFNRPEDDTANIALNLANQTFSISTALQSQFNSFGGKFSDFQLDFEDSENFVQDSFLDLQESFDKLSDTVKILSDDMSSLTDKFLLMEQKRADQLKEESIRIFEEKINQDSKIILAKSLSNHWAKMLNGASIIVLIYILLSTKSSNCFRTASIRLRFTPKSLYPMRDADRKSIIPGLLK